jgi:3-oxoacyl-[acyl-carrier-protein] synthase-3
MAFALIQNVSIRGVAACVPEHIEDNLTIPVFKDGEAERVIAQTGIERKHTILPNSGITVSDLCASAFERLISDLKWERTTLDILVLVSSAGDYITPPTANVLHGKLGLPESCICFDIRQGCPGWIVGLNVLSSMLATGNYKRAILLCGDASTLLNSPLDKETRPLFGDAGTATALEYDESAPVIEFEHGSRGADFEAIISPVGGLRNPLKEDSIKFKEYGEHLVRRDIDCTLDGMGVFSFGLSVVPKSFTALVDKFQINVDNIDCFLFHQANNYMNEKIRKKLKLDPTKVPYSLKDFGNTSCASIPLTLVTQRRTEYSNSPMDTIACAFGVGLAWGSCHFKTDKITCPDLIRI